MNLTENNFKSPWYPLFWPKIVMKILFAWHSFAEYKNYEKFESVLGLVHTMPDKFENANLRAKTEQMFCIHTRAF